MDINAFSARNNRAMVERIANKKTLQEDATRKYTLEDVTTAYNKYIETKNNKSATPEAIKQAKNHMYYVSRQYKAYRESIGKKDKAEIERKVDLVLSEDAEFQPLLSEETAREEAEAAKKEAIMSILEEKDDSFDYCYGIPSQKKYPLYDKKHVRLAVMMFNHVEPRFEKQLALAIMAKMRKYDIPFSMVGDKNRLKSYLPKNAKIEESSLPDYELTDEDYENLLMEYVSYELMAYDEMNLSEGIISTVAGAASKVADTAKKVVKGAKAILPKVGLAATHVGAGIGLGLAGAGVAALIARHKRKKKEEAEAKGLAEEYSQNFISFMAELEESCDINSILALSEHSFIEELSHPEWSKLKTVKDAGKGATYKLSGSSLDEVKDEDDDDDDEWKEHLHEPCPNCKSKDTKVGKHGELICAKCGEVKWSRAYDEPKDEYDEADKDAEDEAEKLTEAVTFVDNAGKLKTTSVEDYVKSMHEYDTKTQIPMYKSKKVKEYKLLSEEELLEAHRDDPEVVNLIDTIKTSTQRLNDLGINISLDPTLAEDGHLSGIMSPKDIAEKHGVSVEDIEKQVKMGIEVEHEHTSDDEEAKRIALDHLYELPDYYTRLDKMEEEGEKALSEQPVYAMHDGHISEVKNLNGTTMSRKDHKEAAKNGYPVKVNGKIEAFTPEKNAKGEPANKITIGKDGKTAKTFFSDYKLPKNFVTESVLDPVQKERCREIFDANDKMLPEVKKQILDRFLEWKKGLDETFSIDAVYLIGSSSGFQYTPTSDVDITIVSHDYTDDIWDRVKDTMPNGNNLEGTQHPVNYFIRTDMNEKLAENIYDIQKDEWLKKTDKAVIDIHMPYIVEMARFFMNAFDLTLKEYERDKMDYLQLKDLDPTKMEISEDERAKALADKLTELKADLDSIRMGNHILRGFLHEAYEEEDGIFEVHIEIKGGDDPRLSPNNLVYKLLERYGYREKIDTTISEAEAFLEAEAADGTLAESNIERHRDYWVCPHCGQALDYGERCDCQDEPKKAEAPKESAVEKAKNDKK